MPLNRWKFIVWFVFLLLLMSICQISGEINRSYTRICKRTQVVLLLLFSYATICNVHIGFGICLAVETILTYSIGMALEKFNNKKILMVMGIGSLLIMLGYFKYSDFFINGFRRMIGIDVITLEIILPIGISFYTFTAIGYLIDVYRGKYRAEINFLNFSLFIVFFPKLTAGPIVRGDCFIPQAREYNGIRLSNIESGIQIFVIGLFKKMVLADRLGVFVDDVFFAPLAYNTFTVVLAVFSYTMQIYFDFSGYSDMAIGIAKIVGFDFPRNFNLPYMAEGMSDFWKRWHISLSSWFQDYLYIPLGGNRKGKKRTYINLMLVMMISGLWHGAGMTYILWGLLHGVISCISRNFGMNDSRGGKKIRIICTFIVVSLLWVIFRADSISNALDVYKALFTLHGGIMQPYTWSFFAAIILVIATSVACVKERERSQHRIDGFYPMLKLNKVWTLTLFFTFIGFTLIFAYFGNTAFIYGKF